MLQMLNSFLTVQGLHVAATLGIADLLADGARGVDDLANVTGAHPASLYRLLRMLAGAGVFCEEADGRFALTPLGGSLRSEGPESVRDWALFVGAPEMWETWGSLRDSVMRGEAAFPRTHGMALWEYMAMHPEVGTPFNRWMSRQSDTWCGTRRPQKRRSGSPSVTPRSASTCAIRAPAGPGPRGPAEV